MAEPTHSALLLELGEVKGSQKAMDDRLGRLERTIENGFESIRDEIGGLRKEMRIEVGSLESKVIDITDPLDDRVKALEITDGRHDGMKSVWSLLGYFVTALVGGCVAVFGNLISHQK